MAQNKAIQKEHPANLAADALALALAAGLPLYFPNGYVGLVGDKFSYLLVCLPVGAAALLLGFVRGGRLARRLRFDPACLWLLGLCACYALAWHFAEDRYTALWGLTGRKNGLVLYLVCTAVFLIVRTFGSKGLLAVLAQVLAAVGCVVTALCWLNFWMFDPLDAYYVFQPETGELFLGTIGNINFTGALLCLCLPLAAGGWLYSERPRAINFACALLLASGLIPVGSDAAWLGCTAALAVAVCSRRATSRTLARLLLLLTGLGGCAFLTWLLLHFLPARSALRTVSAVLCGPAALLWAALGLLAVRWLARRPSVSVYRGARIATALAVVMAALLILAANLLPECPAVLAPLHFDERWAANRGYAWRKLWTIYAEDTTLLQKLVGLGADAVNARLNPDIESTRYMVLLNGEAFDSAHNEFLQHLVCGGALGFICWCGFWAAALCRGAKTGPALVGALLGYMIQSIFSISMPGVFPLVFVLAAAGGPEAAPSGQTGARLCAAAAVSFAALLILTFW